MEKRSFYAPDVDIPGLGQALHEWLAAQGFQVQGFPGANGGIVVQARKESTWRSLAGMNNALTTVLTAEGEHIGVEVGGAKWADKGVAAGVGLLIFWPTLVTAGVGAYQQTQLQSQVWQFIDRHIRTHSAYAGAMPAGYGPPGIPAAPGPAIPPAGAQPPAPLGGAVRPPGPPPLNLGGSAAAAPSEAPGCAQCGQPLRQGAKFCDSCGAPAAANCRSCGKPLRASARFCDECGSPVA